MTASAIIIDSREPAWVQSLAFGGLPTMVSLLDHGDILATCDDDRMIVVERKTSDDLLGSLADGRLMVQVAGLRSVTPWAYLVVSGPLLYGPNGKAITERATGWDWNAVEGALLSVQELGVHVVRCSGDSDFEACIIRLANRDRGEVPLWPNRPSRILSPGEQMLAVLPGIGMEKAQRLVETCVTVGDALAWLTTLDVRDKNVAGIGDVTRRSVRRAMGLDEHEWVAVMSEVPKRVDTQEKAK